MILGLLLLAAHLEGKVLFEEKARQSVCAEEQSWSRVFEVPEDCSATVQIAELRGLSAEDRGEARFWLDDTLLGPLRREFDGAAWESVYPVALRKGEHHLSIECGDESFEIRDVRVGTVEARPPSKTLSKANAAPEAPRPLSATAMELPDFSSCDALTSVQSWPNATPWRAIVLSIVDGRAGRSGEIVDLKAGQRLRLWFKIPPQAGALQFPPLLLSELKTGDGNWALQFSIDHLAMQEDLRAKRDGKPSQPLGYRPGRWTPMDLALCADGNFHLATNEGQVKTEFPVDHKEMHIEIWARELELSLVGELGQERP